MPTNSRVDRVYEALLKKGKSKESAARIAQAVTGEALATGLRTEARETCREDGQRRRRSLRSLRMASRRFPGAA